jgi:hypothetical protein
MHIGRPTGVDREQTRRRITAAAIQHVAEAGYVHGTMKAIADDAGMTSSAIYPYPPPRVPHAGVGLWTEWTTARSPGLAWYRDDTFVLIYDVGRDCSPTSLTQL